MEGSRFLGVLGGVWRGGLGGRLGRGWGIEVGLGTVGGLGVWGGGSRGRLGAVFGALGVWGGLGVGLGWGSTCVEGFGLGWRGLGVGWRGSLTLARGVSVEVSLCH